MPFCPNCGAKLSEDSKFCPTCGTQVTFTEPVDKNTENVQEEKIPIVNDNKNEEVNAEAPDAKNELKRIFKSAFQSAIFAAILAILYSLFLSAPLTGEKGTWKVNFGDSSFNLYDSADFLYGWMSFSGSKVRWATVDEGIMSPHTGSYKCTGSEKTYKLRVKEDGEIFYKVLLTFDGTEGGPNTYLKFRDAKGTSGVMESDSWDGVSADPATNNTYSDNSTSNEDIYYTEDDNEYTEDYDPDVPEEYDFSLDPNTETYSDTSLPNMAVRYFDFLTRGYKAEVYRENMMSPDVAGKSTKDVGMYYCDLDGDDNEELIICDMRELEHVYAVYKGDSFSDSTLMLCSDSSANHNYYVYADGYMDIAKDGAITRYRYNGTKVNDELTLIDTSSLYAISFYERGF